MELNAPQDCADREMNLLKIWQQNVNKSGACQHDLLSSARLVKEGIDIITLQEPAINHYGATISAREWTAVYPTTHTADPHKTRSILLIRANILTNNWKQIDINSGDVTAIRIKGEGGALTLYNIYNDCKHDQTLDILAQSHKHYLEEIGQRAQEQEHLMWIGDFNRHHPHWDAPSDTRLFTTTALEKAEKLINLVANVRLDLALPPRIPTHIHNVTKRWSRLDHVFLSDHSMDTLISCEALAWALRVNTDHVPILTKLDLAVAIAPSRWTTNFREVDWEKFRAALETELAQQGQPVPITSQQALDEECGNITKALQSIINVQVHTTEISPHAKRWWTKELMLLRRQANKLGRASSKRRSNPQDTIHAEFANAKKRYEKEIKYCKRHHWRDWLEKAEDLDIWTAHKYISAPSAAGSSTRIPTLVTMNDGTESLTSSNEDKSKVLAKTFFQEKRSDAQPDSQSMQEQKEQVCELDPITRDQIRRHLAKLKPYKAPGPDGIPNIVLIKCADLITNRLYYIYKAMIEQGLYYAPWKHFTTVVLRKPGKPKYNVAKAYRPIALLNTMIKVLTAILTEQLMYYAEEHNLLPANHFGGRKGRTATDAVHLLVYNIKGAWRKGKVMAVLFLDIEGAFLNADNAQLTRNLLKRRVPVKLVEFVANMLKDRSTTIKFDDHVSLA